MKSSACVVAVGAFTAIGTTVSACTDSLHARESGIRELSWQNKDLSPMRAGFVRQESLGRLHRKTHGLVPDSFASRLVRMAALALEEVAPAISDAGGMVPAIIGLNRSDRLKECSPELFLDNVSRQAQVRLHLEHSEVILGDGTVGARAVQRACALIAAGYPGPLVVGAVDSYCDLPELMKMDLEDRLQAQEGGCGLLPGEGAAMLLIAGRAASPRGTIVALTDLEGEPAFYRTVPGALMGLGLEPLRVEAAYAGVPGDGPRPGSSWQAMLGVALPGGIERVAVHRPVDLMTPSSVFTNLRLPPAGFGRPTGATRSSRWSMSPSARSPVPYRPSPASSARRSTLSPTSTLAC